MSWWDPFVDWFTGDSGSSVGDVLGQTASNAGSALGSLFTGDGSSPGLASYSGGIPFNTTTLDGVNQASAGLMPMSTTSLDGINAASAGLGSDYGGLTNGASIGSAVGSGAADSGGAGLLSQGADYLKKNPSFINPMVQAGLALTKQNAPSAAKSAGYNAAVAGNAGNAAVGNSLINQAPFLANNAEAAAKGASANATSHLQQTLQQQGYKPGDPMYDSAMQQQSFGNRNAETTAYAAGQGQMASQEGLGAGLLTPKNLDAYDSLGSDQNAKQTSDNQTNADLGSAATKAFDIWSGTKQPANAPA
jgi:hypothetical protein